MKYRAWAIVGVTMLFLACKCLPVPNSDDSPPTAGLVIEWHDSTGQTYSETITAESSDLHITASNEHPIAVAYMGADPQGMRSVELDYDMVWYHSNQVTRPLLVAKMIVSSCPREFLTSVETFDSGGVDWDYEFAAASENWFGLSTTSARVWIQTE